MWRRLMVAGAVIALPALQAAQGSSVQSSGAGVVSGRVVVRSERDDQPLAAAAVVLTTLSSRAARVAETNERGEYEFTGVAEGRYSLRVVKAPFVSTPGTAAAMDGSRLFTVGPGETLTGQVEVMRRGGVIAGLVRDRFGKPLGGIAVAAYRVRTFGGSRISASGRADRSIVTDNTGTFRFFGLAAGQYLLAARYPTNLGVGYQVSEGGLLGSPITTVSFQATYFPGTTSLADATPVVADFNQERSGIEFVMQLDADSSLSGSVVDDQGQPARDCDLRLLSDGVEGLPGTMRRVVLSNEGRFAASGVSPGAYRLVARRGDLRAVRTFRATAGGAEEIHLKLSNGRQVSGTVVWTSGKPVAGATVELRRASPGMSVAGIDRLTTSTTASGAFTLAGIIPGEYRLVVGPPPDQQSSVALTASLNGVDLLDYPWRIDETADPDPVTVSMGADLSTLSGTVFDERGRPSSLYSVLVLPRDPQLWRPDGRRVRMAPVALNGTYRIAALVPGDYVVVAVATSNREEALDDPRLAEIDLAGTTIRIVAGVNLRDLLINRWYF